MVGYVAVLSYATDSNPTRGRHAMSQNKEVVLAIVI